MSALRLDNVSADPDQRIANVLTATAHETGDLADLVRWLARNLQAHRAALRDIRALVTVGGSIDSKAEQGLALTDD